MFCSTVRTSAGSTSSASTNTTKNISHLVLVQRGCVLKKYFCILIQTFKIAEQRSKSPLGKSIFSRALVRRVPKVQVPMYDHTSGVLEGEDKTLGHFKVGVFQREFKSQIPGYPGTGVGHPNLLLLLLFIIKFNKKKSCQNLKSWAQVVEKFHMNAYDQKGCKDEIDHNGTGYCPSLLYWVPLVFG